MIGKECDRILDGLVVNEHGELVLDERFRAHLDECAQCREAYKRIQMAKMEEVPNYVPAVMQRIRENCDKILEGLVVNANGNLVLDKSFQEHLDACSQCGEFYNRVEAAKLEKVPDYVSEVMKRLRQMEKPAFVKWMEGLREFVTESVSSFKTRVMISAIAIVIIAVILNFTLVQRPVKNIMDDNTVSIVSDVEVGTIPGAGVLEGISGIKRQRHINIDKVINKQMRLFDSDNQARVSVIEQS